MTDDAWHAGTGRDHTSGKATTRRTSWCPCTPWMDGCELSLATGDEADAVHTRLLPGLKGKEGRKEAGGWTGTRCELKIGSSEPSIAS